MTFSILEESVKPEYLYIDSENKVHLLLPIVGGDTIGLDNTCKTVMEMQTFFYGKDGRPSALQVLDDYAKVLIKDIKILETLGSFPALLRTKQERLVQIKSYQDLLKQLKASPVVEQNSAYPNFPEKIHELLKKQTNCLTVHLSPKVPDYALRTSAPTFRLNRSQLVTVDRGFGIEYEIPDRPDVAGLAYSLRTKLRENLQKIVQKDLRSKLVDEVVEHYKDKPRPSLQALQMYLKTLLQDKFSDKLEGIPDLGISQQGVSIDEQYFSDYIDDYTNLELNEAVDTIFSAALSDDFWSGLEDDDFRPDGTLLLDKRVEKLTMAIQFFLASINIYLKAHQLFNENLGVFLDVTAERISTPIVQKIIEGGSVEDTLFEIINHRLNKKGKPSLTKQDRDAIKQHFKMEYRTIKESPHLDEFIFFRPEVHGGDFFNHKNRISVHFLELIDSIPAPLVAHKERLKQNPIRNLANENKTQSISFLNILEKLNPQNYEGFSSYLFWLIQVKPNFINELSFNELDHLFRHPMWPAVKKLLNAQSNQVVNQAIAQGQIIFNAMHEKISWSEEQWNTAVSSLSQCIESYQSKVFFRFKSSDRKEYISKLEMDLEKLKSQIYFADKISTINNVLKTFEEILKNLPDSSSLKKSILESKKVFSAAFGLEENQKQISSIEQKISAFEKSKIPCWQHRCLLFLSVQWSSNEGIKVIQQLPERYFTPKNITFFNTTDVSQWTSEVLKALQTDNLTLDNTTNLAILAKRGLFINAIEASGLSDSSKKELVNLNQNWWTDHESLEKLLRLEFQDITPELISLLNELPPDLAVTLTQEQLVDIAFNIESKLTWAAKNGLTAVVLNMLNINQQDKNGQTALMIAASTGNIEMVSLLIEKGASLSLTDNNGQAALMLAVSTGNLEMVKALIEKGAPIDVANNNGYTPLMLAVLNDNLDMVSLLIEKSASVEKKDKNGQTALMLAASAGNLEMVRELIKNKADVNVKNDLGRCALDEALEKGDSQMVTELVYHSRDVVIDKTQLYAQLKSKWGGDETKTEKYEELINLILKLKSRYESKMDSDHKSQINETMKTLKESVNAFLEASPTADQINMMNGTLEQLKTLKFEHRNPFFLCFSFLSSFWKSNTQKQVDNFLKKYKP